MAVALDAPQAWAHPAFEPLRPWLGQLAGWPDIARLNDLAASAPRPPVTASGRPVRFGAPEGAGAGHYEQRIFDTGLVGTRPGNLHDAFNALAWIAFPRLKAAINARHVARLPSEGPVRGPLRDLLTLVDEGGVIVACAPDALPGVEALIRDFRWQALFWDGRATLLRDARFVLAGHSAYEKALAPYPGITCKALFVPTPRARLEAPFPALVDWLDGEAAAWVAALPDDAAPRQMPPLPVFGFPGWLADSTRAEFYADRRWFRPGRAGRVQGGAAGKLEHAA
ncbi:MAG: DUF3025 domain-containing protein [Proteobacteria bacterium]|nr:DUF3025 domain-containing protein [Pseudomonadota bacterium]